jgi:dihydrofolate synthase / folylpolyglutamate synthase
MSYQDAIDYLFSFLDSERRLPMQAAEFNLPRTAALLEAIGSPQLRYPSVVIAGTKGKGSTSVMLESMLRAGGFRTGLFTSPHLHSYRERIQVNRAMIGQQAFVRTVERLKPAVAALDPALGPVTTFELGTALALQHFADESVDIALLEVGLGGRYDSVNTVTPLVSAITSLSFDHTQVLGETLPEIAYQKAGIIKPGVPVVSAVQRADALEVIAGVAREQRSTLYVAAEDALAPIGGSSTHSYPIDPAIVRLGLRGAVQRQNARVALGVMMLLAERGFPVAPAALAEGLATTFWPGRLEVASESPLIVLDGAHNGESAAQLLLALRELFAFRRLVLVLGLSRDKDVAAILRELLPASDEVVLAYSRHPRSFTDLEALAALAAPHTAGGLHIGGDIAHALPLAQRLTAPDDLLCVTGSLFAVAEAREVLGLPHIRD